MSCLTDLSDGGARGRVLRDGLAVQGTVELRGVVILVHHEHYHGRLAA